MAFWKNWKIMPIQDFFDEVIQVRDTMGFPDLEYPCNDEIVYILMRDFDETIEFLSHANLLELGCAYEALNDMSHMLPCDKLKTLIELLEKKYEEHPDMDEYTVVETSLELRMAKDILEERLEEGSNKEKDKFEEDEKNE